MKQDMSPQSAARPARSSTPRLSAVADIAAVFRNYPHIGKVLPAMGYSASELSDLRATINGSTAEMVIVGTPADLARMLRLNKPVVRVRYEFAEVGEPRLASWWKDFSTGKAYLTAVHIKGCRLGVAAETQQTMPTNLKSRSILTP
jgi:hypothetical protein